MIIINYHRLTVVYIYILKAILPIINLAINFDFYLNEISKWDFKSININDKPYSNLDTSKLCVIQ